MRYDDSMKRKGPSSVLYSIVMVDGMILRCVMCVIWDRQETKDMDIYEPL